MTCALEYVILIALGVAVAIVGIILLSTSFKGKDTRSFQKEVTSARVVIPVVVSITLALIGLTIYFEYVPENDVTSSLGNNTLMLYIQRPSTILIPVRGIVDEENSKLQATVIYKEPILSIDRVRLSTSADSILTYYSDNTSVRKYYNDTTLLPANTSKKETHILDVRARHDGQVSNTTNLYSIDIFYTDNMTNPGKFTTTFSWPIKTLDFDIVVYFFIVFIGVLVSRYTTKIIRNSSKNKEETKDKGQKSDQSNEHNVGQFDKNDGVWVIVSGIITLLIFSSFQEQVQLTSLLITNISLAFTFGFGFDKILETGSRIAR